METNVFVGRGCIQGQTWGSGNHLFFFTRKRQGYVGGNSKIVEWKFEYYFGEMHTLLNAWHGIFSYTQNQKSEILKAHRIRAALGSGNSFEEAPSLMLLENKCQLSIMELLLHSSVRYRSELDAYLDRENRRSQESYGRLTDYTVSWEEFRNHLSLLERTKYLWHLCEILFLDPSENVTRQLTAWYQQKTPKPKSNIQPDTQQYWETLHLLAMQGRIDVLCDLLDRSEVLDANVVAQTKELIQTHPAVSSGDTATGAGTLGGARAASHFTNMLLRWQDRCQIMQSQVRERGLKELFTIMGGEDRKSSHLMKRYASSWHELLIGKLLYIRPQTEKAEISFLADRCKEDFHSPPGGGSEDKCVEDLLLHHNPNSTITLLYKLDSKFLIAHFIDLMTHAGKLDYLSSTELDPVDFREQCLEEYASTIMFHPSLWQVAVEYFSYCVTSGPSYVYKLIESQPVTSGRTALKLVALCERFKFASLRASILSQLANQSLRQQPPSYASAAHWISLIASTDEQKDRESVGQRLSGICDRVLQAYIYAKDSSARSDALIDMQGVVDNTLVLDSLCPELVFLNKYSTYCKLKSELESGEASKGGIGRGGEEITALEAKEKQTQLIRAALAILVRSLVFRVAPRRFSMHLLKECTWLLHLAEKGEASAGGEGEVMEALAVPMLTVNDTNRLLRCLEELQLSSEFAESSSSHSSPLRQSHQMTDDSTTTHNSLADTTTLNAADTTTLNAIRASLLRNISRAVKYEEDSW